jgi:hypothetical protein
MAYRSPPYIRPGSLDDSPIEDDDGSQEAGYLMPVPLDDPEFSFEGRPEDYPEEWTEQGPKGLRVRSNRRKQAPYSLHVDIDGRICTEGRLTWFIPGKFRFCPSCGHQPSTGAREINKLAGLSAEGRSSATTLLVSSTLRWMGVNECMLPPCRSCSFVSYGIKATGRMTRDGALCAGRRTPA